MLLGFVVLAIAWTWPLALRPGSTMAAPFGDPLLNAWILGWDADRLLHGLRGLWTAPPFYPYPDTLAFSEHLLGIAVPLAPIYWLTGNAVLVYNVALIGSFALAGIGMYLLARDLTGRRDAAVLAALVFMWCPNRAPQVTHLQVLMNGWMPVALWALHRYFATGSRRALAGFVAAFVVQGLSNGYFLFFLAVPVAIVAVVELVRHRDRLPAHALHLGVAALAIGLLIAPVAATYLRVKREQGLSRTRADAVQFGARASDYLTVSHQPRVWSKVLPIGAGEKELFPGAVVVLLALCALIPAVSRVDAETGVVPFTGIVPARVGVPLYTSIAVVAFVLSMGPEPAFGASVRLSTGPYDWLAAVVPGLDGLRAPARFATVVYLALATLAAYGATRLLDRVALPVARIALVLVLGIAAVAEGYMGPLPLERVPSSPMAADRAAYEWLASQPPGPMLELPLGDPDPAVRYQFRTLIHGNRIVNGYSGYGSALQDFLRGPPSTEGGAAADQLAMFRALGLRYVVVHGQLYADAEVARHIVDEMRAQPEHVGRVTTRGPVSIVELRPGASPALPKPTGAEIPRASLTLSASHNTAALPLAIDGSDATRWLSGTQQDGSEWIQVAFDRVRRLSFLRLVMDRRSFGDYPRRLEVEASADGVAFTPLFAGSVLTPLALSLVEQPVAPRIDLALPPTEMRVLRLRQTGRAVRNWYWSVHDIRVWEP
ncbi:MAG: discoidin domain-containing protein [Vicinamibacteraceae bacterium]